MDAVRVYALDYQVRLADGISLRVDFRTRKEDGGILHTKIHQVFVTLGEHTARTTGWVV